MREIKAAQWEEWGLACSEGLSGDSILSREVVALGMPHCPASSSEILPLEF